MTVRVMQDTNSIGSFNNLSDARDYLTQMDDELLDQVYVTCSKNGKQLAAFSTGTEALKWIGAMEYMEEIIADYFAVQALAR